MRFITIISLSFFGMLSANANPPESTSKKHIPISMGINLNEPQSQVDIVTHAQIMGDLAKSFRPFDESIFERVQEALETKGVASVNFNSEDPIVNSVFIDEYATPQADNIYTISRALEDDQTERESFDPKDYQTLDNFKIRGLVNRFAQTRYNRFSEFGVTVNNDKTVLLKRSRFVYTTGLESAKVGDVPDGIYPVYFDGDVDLKVEGFAEIVSCPEKYASAKSCLDIAIPEAPSKEGIKLTFTANSDTHLKNFHLILPTVNHEDVLAGKIVFNPDYLKYIKPFSTLRVMNMTLSSPKSPFECVTTYVKARNVYSLPQEALEAEYLRHTTNITLLGMLKALEPELIRAELIDTDAILKSFKEFKNEDNEIFYTEQEIESIESIIHDLLSDSQYLNLMTFDYRIRESEKALAPIKEQLITLRRKSLEFNWNYVNPDEDYGNCLMKYARNSTDRAKLDDQFWGNSYIKPEEKWRGLPYEVIVELANVTQSNVWINVPHNATEYYVSDMAKYFNESLNKDSKVFLELSNEVWNGAFASQKYFIGLANHRQEQYVSQFFDRFEDYLKTSDDEVVSYRNMRAGYLDYFYKFKKEVTDEFEDLKSCESRSNLNTLVDGLKLTKTGLSMGELTKPEATSDSQLRLRPHGPTMAKLSQFYTIDIEDFNCNKLVDNEYTGNNKFIADIQYKKGNFFDKLALKIPYMSAYWLGYTGAAKGKLKIQVDGGNGDFKDVFVDRFTYIKEHKSELHSPDLVYHYTGDAIRDLQKDLFTEFKKGWDKRVAERFGFDFQKNSEVYVLKNLDRAYRFMAQMAYVDRLDRVAKIWLESGMDEQNLIVTLATKQNNPVLTKIMLSHAAKTESIKRIDAVATSAYFYACFGNLNHDDKVISPHKFGPCHDVAKGVLNAKTAQEVIDVIKDPNNPRGVEAVRKELIAQNKEINDIDDRIQLVAYEGGHNLALTNLGRDQQKYFDRHPELKAEKLALFKEAIELEGMGAITKHLYKVWLEEDGKVFNNFYMPQSFHEWGSLGLSESLSDMETPRYLVASEFAAVFEKMEKAVSAAIKSPASKAEPAQ